MNMLLHLPSNVLHLTWCDLDKQKASADCLLTAVSILFMLLRMITVTMMFVPGHACHYTLECHRIIVVEFRTCAFHAAEYVERYLHCDQLVSHRTYECVLVPGYIMPVMKPLLSSMIGLKRFTIEAAFFERSAHSGSVANSSGLDCLLVCHLLLIKCLWSWTVRATHCYSPFC